MGGRGLEYVASLRSPGSWDLSRSGRHLSTHRSFSEAERAAVESERRRRLRRRTLRHLVTAGVALLALIPAIGLRERHNPAYDEALAFAAEMEGVYGQVESGTVALESAADRVPGLAGETFELNRGEVTEDYHVLVGLHDEDCYLLRWVQGDVPFVARLPEGDRCEPGEGTLSFNPADFAAIAVNLTATSPLDWDPVLPAGVVLRIWFFPVVFLLAFVILQQLVSASLRSGRETAVPIVSVRRVECGL